eukprot:gnl/TRDRNA2_/TRDRNA2_45180_c0_seq1.p1 gnl/TRDRNA2_/TRDRNA2_45180_c0~~gnl/TRDRNA2_/TRDRNA2_45180_c0_seq1.p1  ORF type:complete len:179 (-),score=37.56 gnl/TRDRNA2_/TRDRNA2_45180_c0_seq1:86-622(-)
MNGISFAEFENSSFDSLYQRDFAGARTADDLAKKLPEGNYGLHVENGRPVARLAAPARPRALGSSSDSRQMPLSNAPTYSQAPRQQQALPPGPQMAGSFRQPPAATSQRRALPAATSREPIPLNDMGHMPGNTRVEHAWKPSREADVRAVHSSMQQPAKALPPPPQSNAGAFVNWKSN